MQSNSSFRTAGLVLRELTAQDLPSLLELDSDPEVMRHITDGRPNGPAEYAELLPRMLAYTGQDYGSYAAEHDARFVGWFHLRPSCFDDAELELGYRLCARVWGRGLATEGSRALLDHAFHTLRRPWVDACAHAENLASIAVMRRCGMQFDRSFEHPRAQIMVERYWVQRDTYLEQAPSSPQVKRAP